MKSSPVRPQTGRRQTATIATAIVGSIWAAAIRVFTSTRARVASSGWSYDAVGNLLNDGVHSYTYDAENKIKSVDAATAYVYDGEGQRVKKLVGGKTRFIYGISGELIAEYSGANGLFLKEYV